LYGFVKENYSFANLRQKVLPMKFHKTLLLAVLATLIVSCKSTKNAGTSNNQQTESNVERFADLQILRYEVTGLDKLSASQQELVYYLSEAALSGRDIIYAQNYRHNIQIRRTLENIYNNYSGNRESKDWLAFETYLKRIWFSNGIHHHYSEKKINPEFSSDYFTSLVKGTNSGTWPLLEGDNLDKMLKRISPVMFDPAIDNKKVNKNAKADMVFNSANNYYGADVTQAEATKFYKNMAIEGDAQPISYGLNSRLVKENGELVEKTYKVGGLYGEAIKKIVFWLEKAGTVAENQEQRRYFDLLVAYYTTGDLKIWDDCNIEWVKSTKGDIDLINGFIEVYGDALGFKSSYESVVQLTDFDASARMKVLADNVQWFEDKSSIMKEHKKESVKGVSYKVVNVAMEAGDAAPSTPIGINLPNANWIRKTHGSKSVSLGNIVSAYNSAGGKGTVDEFYLSKDVRERIKKYGKLGSKMHTAMHEVIGHASGQINPGIGTPKETLKNYSNTLEEARADLVALYFILDNKIVDLGLVKDLDVGKAEYDSYIANGMMLQLRRLDDGDNLEEDHMRNRQLVAAWAFEKGAKDNVVEKKTVKGKTYFVVNDYKKLRIIFGQLLREIQRIKSEGDYNAAEKLVEGYGVQVDQKLLKEVKQRYSKFNRAPYSGFLQPRYSVKWKDGKFVSMDVSYDERFAEQMIRLSKDYGFLPNSGN
jgi:dipeptidyl-peptidase III